MLRRRELSFLAALVGSSALVGCSGQSSESAQRSGSSAITEEVAEVEGEEAAVSDAPSGLLAYSLQVLVHQAKPATQKPIGDAAEYRRLHDAKAGKWYNELWHNGKLLSRSYVEGNEPLDPPLPKTEASLDIVAE